MGTHSGPGSLHSLPFAELNGDKWFEDVIGAPLEHLLSLEEPPVSLLSPSEAALSGE